MCLLLPVPSCASSSQSLHVPPPSSPFMCRLLPVPSCAFSFQSLNVPPPSSPLMCRLLPVPSCAASFQSLHVLLPFRPHSMCPLVHVSPLFNTLFVLPPFHTSHIPNPVLKILHAPQHLNRDCPLPTRSHQKCRTHGHDTSAPKCPSPPNAKPPRVPHSRTRHQRAKRRRHSVQRHHLHVDTCVECSTPHPQVNPAEPKEAVQAASSTVSAAARFSRQRNAHVSCCDAFDAEGRAASAAATGWTACACCAAAAVQKHIVRRDRQLVVGAVKEADAAAAAAERARHLGWFGRFPARADAAAIASMHAVRLGQVRRFWARTAAARCCISRGMAFWHADREAAHPPVALPPIVRLQRYGSMPLQPQAGNGQRGPAAAAAVGFAAVRIRAPLLVAQRPQPPAPVTRQRGPNGDAGGAHRCLRPDARARADGERRRAQQAKRQQRVVRMQRTQLRHKAGRVGREAAHQQRPRQLEQSHGKAAAREHAHPPAHRRRARMERRGTGEHC
eukprot:361496-Chlamydomonas_euryale.AAC.5